MEMITAIQEIINTMGLPIAMIFYFIYDKQQTLKPLIDAVNNNTHTIDKLMEVIKMAEKEGYFDE